MKLSLNNEPVFFSTGGVNWKAGQPTLALIHGAGLDRTAWTLFTRYFARRGYNVVAPDFPGHGNSGGEALTSIEAMAKWVNAVLEQCAEESKELSLEDVRLAGHSMGSLVALQAVGDEPIRYASVALLGTAYPMVVGPPLLEAAKANDEAAIQMITLYGHSPASRLGRNPIAGISVMNVGAALLRNAAPGVLHNDLAACHNYAEGEQAAAAAGASSVTLILGVDDLMTMPKGGRALAGLISGSDVIEIKDCGHMLLGEQPEAVLQAMLVAFNRSK